jgi:transcriptional regulator of met regulon
VWMDHNMAMPADSLPDFKQQVTNMKHRCDTDICREAMLSLMTGSKLDQSYDHLFYVAIMDNQVDN